RDLDYPAGQHLHLRPFARIAHRQLDVVREPYATQLAVPPRFRAALAETMPVGERDTAVHRLFVIAVVIGHAERRAIGQLVGRDQVAPPDLDPVDAGFDRREVAQALHDEHRLGPAGAAIRGGRHGVAVDLVGAREYAHALAQRDDRGGVGADIAQMRAAHRQEAALLVERQLDLGGEVAALIVAEERFAALAYPLHRPADPLRRPQNQREFWKDRILGSEVSSDLIRHDANLLRLNPEDGGAFPLLTHDTAAADVQE